MDLHARCLRAVRRFRPTGLVPAEHSDVDLAARIRAKLEEDGLSPGEAGTLHDDLALLALVSPRIVRSPEAECIHDDDSYEKFLEPIVSLARNVLGDVRVRSRLVSDGELAEIILTAPGREHGFRLSQPGDRADTIGAIRGLNEFVRGSNHSFFTVEAADGLIAFLSDEEAGVLRALGVVLEEGGEELYFDCEGCRKRVEVSADRAGLRYACPACGVKATMPVPPAATKDAPFASCHTLKTAYLRTVIGLPEAGIEIDEDDDIERLRSRRFGRFVLVTGDDGVCRWTYLTPYPWTDAVAADVEKDILEVFREGLPHMNRRFALLSPHPPAERFRFLLSDTLVSRFELIITSSLRVPGRLPPEDMATEWNSLGSAILKGHLGLTEGMKITDYLAAVDRMIREELRPEWAAQKPPFAGAGIPVGFLAAVGAAVGEAMADAARPAGAKVAWVKEAAALRGVALSLVRPTPRKEVRLDVLREVLDRLSGLKTGRFWDVLDQAVSKLEEP